MTAEREGVAIVESEKGGMDGSEAEEPKIRAMLTMKMNDANIQISKTTNGYSLKSKLIPPSCSGKGRLFISSPSRPGLQVRSVSSS